MKNICFYLFIICLFSSCALFKKFISTPSVTSKSSFEKEKALLNPSSTSNLVLKKIHQQSLHGLLNKKQINKLKQILKSSKEKDIIRMILARDLFKKSKYKKALFMYSKIKKKPWRQKALLKKSAIYFHLHNYKKALFFIEKAEQDFIPAYLEKELYTLKLPILLKQKDKDKVNLLNTYCHLLAFEKGSESSLYTNKASQLIFQMEKSQLLDIYKEDFIEPVKDLVFFKLGELFFFEEDFKESKYFLKKFLKNSNQNYLEKKASKYILAINTRRKVNPKNIGAILPLSGASSVIGKRSLKGLKTALRFYSNEKSFFNLIVIDNKGQEELTRKAVQKLVTQHHVISIVGGILSRPALALSEEAQNFGVPTIVMAQKSGLTKEKSYIFQNSLTAKILTHQLSYYLINSLNIKKFAILYPNDPYGVEYANTFWSAVEQNGGQITGVQFYKPKETDFNGVIKRLTGLYYLEDRIKEYKENLKSWYLKNPSSSKRQKPPKDILDPIVEFQAIFIPDSLKTLKSIASHLVYNDVFDVMLVGTSLWNKNFSTKKNKYKYNIIFADLNLKDPLFKKSSFYKDFTNTFYFSPRVFELLFYESAVFLHQAIAQGIKTRSNLKHYLSSLKNTHGPLGKISLSKNREFIHNLQIFQMKDKAPLPISNSSL